MRRRSRRIAYLVQAVEEGDQIEILLRIVLGRRNLGGNGVSWRWTSAKDQLEAQKRARSNKFAGNQNRGALAKLVAYLPIGFSAFRRGARSASLGWFLFSGGTS
jgi:hypothetical protein